MFFWAYWAAKGSTTMPPSSALVSRPGPMFGQAMLMVCTSAMVSPSVSMKRPSMKCSTEAGVLMATILPLRSLAEVTEALRSLRRISVSLE